MQIKNKKVKLNKRVKKNNITLFEGKVKRVKGDVLIYLKLNKKFKDVFSGDGQVGISTILFDKDNKGVKYYKLPNDYDKREDVLSFIRSIGRLINRDLSYDSLGSRSFFTGNISMLRLVDIYEGVWVKAPVILTKEEYKSWLNLISKVLGKIYLNYIKDYELEVTLVDKQ